jgi:hypothetical protein
MVGGRAPLRKLLGNQALTRAPDPRSSRPVDLARQRAQHVRDGDRI